MKRSPKIKADRDGVHPVNRRHNLMQKLERLHPDKQKPSMWTHKFVASDSNPYLWLGLCGKTSKRSWQFVYKDDQVTCPRCLELIGNKTIGDVTK